MPRILRVLQKDASPSQREVADRWGCRRMRLASHVRLRETGVITGQTLRLWIMSESGWVWTGFLSMLRTRDHSPEWLEEFRKTVLGIEKHLDVFRIAGELRYTLLKIVAQEHEPIF